MGGSSLERVEVLPPGGVGASSAGGEAVSPVAGAGSLGSTLVSSLGRVILRPWDASDNSASSAFLVVIWLLWSDRGSGVGAGSSGGGRRGGGAGGWGGMLLSVYGGLGDVLVFRVGVVTVLLGGWLACHVVLGGAGFVVRVGVW